MMLALCPCCTNLSYANCCEPYHTKRNHATTPEILMRARYSAYALHLIDYLWQTTHPAMRHLYDKKQVESWAMANVWLRLEICLADRDVVEFKAHYQNGSEKFIHHERSTFKKENGNWYYYKGAYF